MNKLIFGFIILLEAHLAVAGTGSPRKYTCSLSNWDTQKEVPFELPVGSVSIFKAGDARMAVIFVTSTGPTEVPTGLYIQIRDVNGGDIYAQTVVSGFPDKISLWSFKPGASLDCNSP